MSPTRDPGRIEPARRPLDDPLHRLVLAVHLRADAGHAPDDRQDRQPDGGGRDGDRGRDHAAARRGRQLGRDHRRACGRHRGGRGRLAARPDDRDATDGGALQRRRRRRGRADRVVGVPSRAGRLPARRVRPGPVRSRDRLGLVLGLEHRLREAARPDPDQADRGAGPAGDQRAAAGRPDRRLRDPAPPPTTRRRRSSSRSWSARRSSATWWCCRSAAPTCRSSSRC